MLEPDADLIVDLITGLLKKPIKRVLNIIPFSAVELEKVEEGVLFLSYREKNYAIGEGVNAGQKFQQTSDVTISRFLILMKDKVGHLGELHTDWL